MPKKVSSSSSSSSSFSSRSRYRRVRGEQEEEEEEERCSPRGMPKGFVPILVGVEATSAERILVRVNKFKDPRVAGLLDMAELELGCQPHGVLRVTCDADHFRRLVGAS